MITMRSFSSSWMLFVTVFSLARVDAWAQGSTLPPVAPTAAMLSSGTAGPVPAGTQARTAEVTYVDGLLHIEASNASLNQILRETGRLTGMKITGGVTDDRVYGTYGPAPVSQVITSLLDGTSTNILIVDKTSDAPARLILTPRQGGPTPPNPNAAMNAGNEEPQQQPYPGPQPSPAARQFQPAVLTGPPGLGGLPPSNGGQTGSPINGGADLGTTPGAFVPAGQSPPDATAQPGLQQPGTPVAIPDPGQPQSPNGVSTPQQIYEQLMRLRQQQQQQPNPQ